MLATQLRRVDNPSGVQNLLTAVAQSTSFMCPENGSRDSWGDVRAADLIADLVTSGATERMCLRFGPPFPTNSDLSMLVQLRRDIVSWSGVYQLVGFLSSFESKILNGIAQLSSSMGTKDIMTSTRVAVMTSKALGMLCRWAMFGASSLPYGSNTAMRSLLHGLGGELPPAGRYQFEDIPSAIEEIKQLLERDEIKSDAAKTHIRHVLEWSERCKRGS